MNVTGYVLGILLGVKLFIRRSKGYVPQRWCASNSLLAQGSDRALVTVTGLTTTLAVLAAALIAYCLTSAANARATFREQTLSFDYHDCLRWLPHSLDSIASWNVFWTYLALACAFWAVWDWLQGKTMPEQRRPSENSDLAITAPLLPFPGRLRRRLWVLAVNGRSEEHTSE